MFDLAFLFSNDQAITTTALSTDNHKFSVARDMTEGEYVGNILVTEAFVGGTSVAFELVAADNDAMTTNLVVLGSTGAILTADLALGRPINVSCSKGLGKRRTHYGMRYTVVGTYTAGKVTSGASGMYLQTQDTAPAYQF